MQKYSDNIPIIFLFKWQEVGAVTLMHNTATLRSFTSPGSAADSGTIRFECIET